MARVADQGEARKSPNHGCASVSAYQAPLGLALPFWEKCVVGGWFFDAWRGADPCDKRREKCRKEIETDKQLEHYDRARQVRRGDDIAIADRGQGHEAEVGSVEAS